MAQATTVIIPTAAAAARRDLVREAIDSVLAQHGAEVVPMVVVNGTIFDPALRDWLQAHPGLRYTYLEQGGLPGAIAHGRSLVDTPYFSYLDDDDLYLPDAIALRMALIEAHDGYDAAVTCGYRDRNGKRWVEEIGAAQCNAAPAMALVRGNWLASCGGLYRTATVGMEFFSNVPPYVEWTEIAFRLARERRLHFSDTPSFVVRLSESGLSSHTAMGYAPSALIRRFLATPLPEELRRAFEQKLRNNLHSMAEHELLQGNIGAAWRNHFQSMAGAYGLRFVAYTRKLLFASLLSFHRAKK